MALSIEEVEHIARLARLSLTAEEKNLYREQLSDILEHVARLQELDTEGILPTSSVLPPRSVLRDDEPRPGLGAEVLLKSAADSEDAQYKVPPIID
jgi:aspartyl-tRNA(Asn)/glutamyl-tRNA(Gln) amidotransferase subunit C